MYPVWTSVKVKSANADHDREGQAGTVFATNREKHPDECVVKFDLDSTEEAVKVVDLVTL